MTGSRNRSKAKATKPKIMLENGDLAAAVSAACSAVREHVFVQGGRMVRITVAGAAAKGKLDGSATEPTQIVAVDQDWLRWKLSKCAVLTRKDARMLEGEKRIDPPKELVSAIIAAAPEPEIGLRPLKGLVHAPLVRPDGSLVTQPGYDAQTGLFFAFDDELPRTRSARPTRSAAREAAAVLKKLLRYFPFDGDADFAVALSAILTAIQRPVLPSSPMHAFDSPTPGTGKTKLTATISAIATGARASVMSVGPHPEETNKRLDAAILAGTPVLVLDNIEAPLGGDKLCTLLSEPRIAVRPLGGSTMLSLPTSTTVLATGNNMRLKGDVVRRALVARLDAGVERPEQREFDQDVVAEALAQRNELVAAALTIIRSYHVAGAPAVVKPLGSFEEWNRMVRAPLAWAGAGDPVATMDRLREDDPVLSDLRALHTSWFEELGGDWVTVADAVKAAETGPGALWEAMKGVADNRIGVDRKRLGHYLRRNVDRLVEGAKIESGEKRRGAATWRIAR